jgi:DNA mismatch endonuclease (patch repair protein)
MSRSKLPTDPKRRALMQRVRQARTPAEDHVAALCRKLRLRYRRNVRTLPGSPDLANKTRHWAIFVNGCFWHQHTGCTKATMPTRNYDFWSTKFQANRRRDAKKIKLLREKGYRVLLIWECELANEKRVAKRLSNLRKARIVYSA